MTLLKQYGINDVVSSIVTMKLNRKRSICINTTKKVRGKVPESVNFFDNDWFEN